MNSPPATPLPPPVLCSTKCAPRPRAPGAYSPAAFCGVTPDLAAARLQAVWIAVMGFVGCQLSWLLSPFLGDPVSPPHWVARLYWQYNFYEYVWLCIREAAR